MDNSNVSFNLYQRKPYQLAFAGAETNNGECNTQIMEFNFKGGDISMFQVPNTYDFTYRKDFENLQKIKTKAQAGEKLYIGNHEAYLSSLNKLPIRKGDQLGSRYRILFWQTENSNVFVFFNSNKLDPSYGIDNSEIIKMAESVSPLNQPQTFFHT